MVDTVTVADRDGNEFEVEVGIDGENPVSPDNPPAKATLLPPSGGLSFEKHDSNSPSADEAKERYQVQVENVTGGTEGGDVDPDEVDEDGDVPKETPDEDGKPGGNASRDDWVAYAKSDAGGNKTDEELEGKSRDEIRDSYND